MNFRPTDRRASLEPAQRAALGEQAQDVFDKDQLWLYGLPETVHRHENEEAKSSSGTNNFATTCGGANKKTPGTVDLDGV